MGEMTSFYEEMLGVSGGWKVSEVIKNHSKMEVSVKLSYSQPDTGYLCPKCLKKSIYHDSRDRSFRHLDTCEYKTWILVRFPRVECPLCGTQAILPAFVEKDSRFTNAFERKIEELCRSSTTKKVARDYGLNWKAVNGIKKRSLKRGRERQRRGAPRLVKNISIDETSYKKHHDYVTIICDADQGTVLAVLTDREAATVTNWFKTQLIADFSEIQSISMDMAPSYIRAVRDSFPNADELICFDRFHISQLFSRAIDSIRRKESATFKFGENPLSRTRFDWLRNSSKVDNRAQKRREFLELTRKPLKTAKAWKLKEKAAGLWDYENYGSAVKVWKKLIWQLRHSRIEELYKLGGTVKFHLTGILNSIMLRASNGIAEARNSCIQRIKYMGCGYRNKARFSDEIIFQFGGLDMAF